MSSSRVSSGQSRPLRWRSWLHSFLGVQASSSAANGPELLNLYGHYRSSVSSTDNRTLSKSVQNSSSRRGTRLSPRESRRPQRRFTKFATVPGVGAPPARAATAQRPNADCVWPRAVRPGSLSAGMQGARAAALPCAPGSQENHRRRGVGPHPLGVFCRAWLVRRRFGKLW